MIFLYDKLNQIDEFCWLFGYVRHLREHTPDQIREGTKADQQVDLNEQAVQGGVGFWGGTDEGDGKLKKLVGEDQQGIRLIEQYFGAEVYGTGFPLQVVAGILRRVVA